MLAHAFANALASWPGRCELCRGWSAHALCRPCVARHVLRQPRCVRCALPLGSAASASVCGRCLRDPPPYERTVCALDYGFPWDRLIAEFKFGRRTELAAALAPLLDDAIAHDAAALRSDLVVVPVPLAPARLAERGFNQAWELARRLARWHRLRSRPAALRRVLAAAPQAALTRAERERNLRNAFAPAPDAALDGAHVALVDDVLTTGTTAREAAAALLRAGAASVRLWVLARTPEPARGPRAQ